MAPAQGRAPGLTLNPHSQPGLSWKNLIIDLLEVNVKRAVIYARVSKAYKDDDDRLTIETQLADCTEYCQERGYKIVKEYVDKDKYRVRKKLVNPSGARKDRPAYLDMLKAARRNEFDVIVSWKEDRLYRGMYAALPLSEVLDEKRGALAVELVTETFDHKMLGIKAAIAKLELDNIRERMVRGRQARLERGEVPGGPVRYGYGKGEDNRLVVNEEEAGIVQRIYEWYVQGSNNMEIRRKLNSMGISPRISKVWSKATIQNILTFTGYATGEYTTKLDGKVFTIPCSPIISKDLWQKALEVRSENKAYRGRNVKEDYLCRGMVVCLCGWKWTARTCYGKYQHGKSGYYGCARKDHQPEQVHPDCPGTIGSKKLDEFVWDFIVSLCRNPSVIQDAVDKKIACLREEQEGFEDEAERLQREIDSIQEERQWVITQARKGRITEDDMDMQLTALHFQTLDLRKKHSDKLAAMAVRSQAEKLKAWAEQYLRDIETGLNALETPPDGMSKAEKAWLYEVLGASRFEAKFEGDNLAALEWAILEEKRRIVRTLIREVLVVKGKRGEKKIIPQLVLEIPMEYASLVYDDQSLEYVEQARSMIEG